MLLAFLTALETAIAAQGRTLAVAGHALHKGTPREIFVRDFLRNQLPSGVCIGTGEVIDCRSQAGESRHQHDIVLYRADSPRLHFGGEIHCFLAESVVATLEVKSTLDRAGIDQAVGAAAGLKQLRRRFRGGPIQFRGPPAILTYVVAYQGPARPSTVHGWIQAAHEARGIDRASLPTTREERIFTPAPSIDGVFVLERGSLLFNNTALGLTDTPEGLRPDARWIALETAEHNLLLLFLLLTAALGAEALRALDPSPYVDGFRFHQREFLP